MGFNNSKKQEMSDRKIIYLDDAIDAIYKCTDYYIGNLPIMIDKADAYKALDALPPVQLEIIRCKNCEHWRQQTNYQGTPLPFGFCESDDMWRSLYGETYEVSHINTDEDFYCGYAERRIYD